MRNEKQKSVDYYRVLGVSPSATQDEIHRAWRREAKHWHPDRNSSTDASERIRLVNEAWWTLCDESRRAVYDQRHAASGQFRGGWSTNAGWNRTHQNHSSKSERNRNRPSGEASAMLQSTSTRGRRGYFGRLLVVFGVPRVAGAAVALLVVISVGIAVFWNLRDECEGTNSLHELLYRTNEGFRDHIEVEAWEVEALKTAGTDLRDRDYHCRTALTIASLNGPSAELLSSLIGPGVLERSPDALRNLIEDPTVGFSEVAVLTDRGAVMYAPKYTGGTDYIGWVIEERMKYPKDEYPAAIAHTLFHGWPNSVLKLLAEARKHAGTNPLEEAVIFRRSEAVLRLLIAAGAMGTGELALNYLLRRDYVDPAQVQLLVDAGAPLGARDYARQTPLEIGLSMRHPRIIIEMVTPR